MSYLDELEKETDPLDVASNRALAETHLRVQAQRAKVAPKQVKNPDGTWPDPDCIECGNPIGLERLEATGSNLCVECARAKELKEKNHAR